MGESRPGGRGLTRREFLLASGGAGAGLLVVPGCGVGVGSNPAAIAEVAAGGGKQYSGPPVELDFWNGFTGGDGQVMGKLVQQFSSEHENIDISMVTIQWVDFYQKVPAAVAAGRGPDVGVMHVDQLGTNAAHGVIVPLDAVAETLSLNEEAFAPVPWKAGVYRGKRYGIPLDVHPLGMYYNKAVMDKAGLDPSAPPQTREEYMQALRQMKEIGIKGSWIPPSLFTGWHWFVSLLWQFGGSLYNEEATQATVASEAGVEALTWMRGVIQDGYSPRNVAQDGDVIALQNGENAFNWNGIWWINGMEAVPDLEWGAAPLPRIGTQKAAWANSHNLVIMNQGREDANKLQASAVFIDWLSKHSLEWAKGGQVPVRTSVLESEGFGELKWQLEFAKELPYVHYEPTVPGIIEISQNILYQGYNEAILFRKEPKAALQEAVRRANPLLERNRQKYGEGG